jgi:late competence protein required for DNA uptake (superfamily II DNA/RNA helicase)
MAVRFKQKCMRCKKNYVTVSGSQRFAVCYECQKKELRGKITDKKMKELFDIPEEFYKKNSFLRDIKANYLRFGKLSEKQVEAFRKVVKELEEKETKSP